MNRFFQNKKKFFVLTIVVLALMSLPKVSLAFDFPGSDLFYGLLWNFVNVTFGRLTWAGGLLLDTAITHFVVGFGAYYVNSGVGNAIDTLWGTVRDIFNLTFIFGLVFIGFKMILDSSDSSAKRMLGSLLIAALMVNFSLFITKSVVDFSNILAKQFSTQFVSEENPNEYDVSSSFMNLLGINGIFDAGEEYKGKGLGYILGTMWLFAIAAFVFFAGGILLVIRFVVLSIYMLLSPLMFIGFVFPGMDGKFKEYWRGFLNRAFFAPAYLLMLYFSFNILSKLNTYINPGDREGSFAALTGGTETEAAASFQETIIYFILVCVFLIASLVVANKMGAQGASTAISIGKRASNAVRSRVQTTAGSATFGTARVIGERSVGRLGNAISNNSTVNRWAAKSATMAGVKKAAAYVGDASFDARRVAGFGKAAGIGEGAKGGYATRIKEKQEADKKFVDSLETIDIKKDRDGRYLDDTVTQSVAVGLDKQRSDTTTDLGKDVAARKQAEKLVTEKKNTLEQIDVKYKVDKNPLEEKIKNLELQLSNLSPNDVAARNKLEKEKSETKESLLEIDKNQKIEKINLEDELRKSIRQFELLSKREKDTEKKAILSEEAKIIYQNQLSFIERREKEAARYQKIFTPITAGGGVGAVLGSASVGSAIGAVAAAPIALAGTAVIHASGDLASASAKNLRKMYGSDGSKMTAKKQKQEDVKILSEIIKENSDEKPKEKDDNKDKDG